jgi:hypothetical protein
MIDNIGGDERFGRSAVLTVSLREGDGGASGWS